MSSISDGSRKTGHKIGSNRGILRARRDRRREEAEARQRAAAARNPIDHLRLLDSRPGESKKERAKIAFAAREAIKETA